MVLTLKNFHLLYLVTGRQEMYDGEQIKVDAWLNTPLSGSQARARNRFVKILAEKAQGIEAERMAIINRTAMPGLDGKPLTDDKGQAEFTTEGRIKFNQEYLEAMNDDCLIDVTESNKKDIETVKTILEELPTGLDANEGVVYEDIMAAFEKALA